MHRPKTLGLIIIGLLSILTVYLYGGSGYGNLAGSLTESDIRLQLRTRADTNGDGILTASEIRKAFVSILRSVITGNTVDDVNGDGTVNRADISAAVGGFRVLLAAECGNGRLEVGEACDDGDTESDDGCSDACVTEPHFICDGEPSVCADMSLCGNGNVDSDGVDGIAGTADDEQCDGGSSNAEDGCSPSCKRNGECRDLLDNDGDGTIDIPGSMSVITRATGAVLTAKPMPDLVRGPYTYVTSYLGGAASLTTYDWRSGATAGTSAGRGGNAPVYHDTLRSLFVQDRDATFGAYGRQRLNRFSVEGPAAFLGAYEAEKTSQYFSTPLIRPNGAELLLLVTDTQYPYVYRTPPTVVSIDPGTMQANGQVTLPIGATGSIVAFKLDHERHKAYVFENIPGAAGTISEHRLIAHVIDLLTMTAIDRRLLVTGDEVQKIEFDDVNHIIVLIQNPTQTMRTTVTAVSSIDFSTIGTLTVHNGSLFTFENRNYNRVFIDKVIWLDTSRRSMLLAVNYTPVTNDDRSVLINVNYATTPITTQTITSLPRVLLETLHTSSITANYLVLPSDSQRQVLYMRPRNRTTQDPWISFDFASGRVTKRSTTEMVGTVYADALRYDTDEKNLLIIPAGLHVPDSYDVHPPALMNVGDSDCSTAE